MTEYRVYWEIYTDCKTPKQAADVAIGCFERENRKTETFMVDDLATGKIVQVKVRKPWAR